MYRIGELAQLAGVSKRTIDYYTNLGLLTAKRSDSNYRYYDETALDTLRFIESCKKMHMPLCEIKDILRQKPSPDGEPAFLKEQVVELAKHIHQLESELVHMKPLLESLTEEQRQEIKKNLSSQASALIQTLLLLII
ncbi:MAG: MerR family transcriptional regulator [Ectobacillus sp.]